MKLWIKNRKEVNNPPLQRSAFYGGGDACTGVCRLFIGGSEKEQQPLHEGNTLGCSPSLRRCRGVPCPL